MQKGREYFDSGVRLVRHAFSEAKEYAAGEQLSGGDPLPDFICRVGELFGR